MLTTYKSRWEIFLDIEPHLIIKSFEFLQSTEWYSQLEYQLVYYWNKRLIFKDSPIKTWLNKILFKTRFKLLIYFDPLSSDNLFFLVWIEQWTIEYFAATKYYCAGPWYHKTLNGSAWHWWPGSATALMTWYF